jgi:histidinol-phosphate phosphatase family protein
VIAVGKKHGIPVVCWHMETTLEDAQYNACLRMIDRVGKVLPPEESKIHKDPNLFPVAVLYNYRKEFEKPTTAEGFAQVVEVLFERRPQPGHVNKALILDYDGCLRRTRSGDKYPVDPDDVEVLPGRSDVLRKFQKAGYRLLGASNQSGIAKGELTEEEAEACFERTNKLLGVAIEVAYCPHRVPPISCYCRKPGPGLGVQWIQKYKLDGAKTVMVGDMTTDATFAARCGILYCNADEFFDEGRYKEFLK